MLHYHYVLMDVAFFSCLIFVCFLTTGDFFSLCSQHVSSRVASTASVTRKTRRSATSQVEKQYYLAGLKMSMCER